MPSESTYLFVDGGHLTEDYRSAMSTWFVSRDGNDQPVNPDFELSAIRDHLKADKVFYYDCVPDAPKDGEDQKAFEQRRDAQLERLNRFQRSANCHVRQGVMVGRKGGKRFDQKQVDVLLAVDAMSHAARGNMRTAVLMTGDQDFLPLVDALVGLGIFVHVWSAPKSVSRALSESADVFVPIQFSRFAIWTQTEVQRIRSFPVQHTGTPSELGERRGKGLLPEGGLFVLYEKPPRRPDGQFTFTALVDVDPVRGMRAAYWQHRDRDALLDFCQNEFGRIDWSQSPRSFYPW